MHKLESNNIFLWILFILVFVPVAVSGQTKALEIPEFLSEDRDYTRIDLISYMDILEYPADSIHVEDLDSPLLEQHFVKFNGELAFDSAYWLKVELKGNEQKSAAYFLRTNRFEEVLLYEQSADGTFVEKVNGYKVKPPRKDIILEYTVTYFEFTLNPGEQKTLYFLVKTGDHGRVERPFFEVYGAAQFHEWLRNVELHAIILSSIFAAVILYNLLLYFTIRATIYLTYIAFVFGIGSIITSIYFLPFIFPSFHALKIAQILQCGAFFFFFKFVIHFLELRKHDDPKIKILKYLSNGILLFIIPWVLQIVLDTAFLLILEWQVPFTAYIIFTCLFVLVISVEAFSGASKDLRYFLVANLTLVIALVVGSIIHFLPYLEIVSRLQIRIIPFLLIGYGGVGQTVLYALAIGSSIVRLEKEKSRAVQDKLKIQENINVQLEEKVVNRTKQLEHRNRENELLLGEIHHRVKNNLQVISSLLKLQSRQLEDGLAKSAVLEGRARVKAMALIHQRLYQQDQFSAIQMDGYIKNLVENLALSYGYSSDDFQFSLEAAKLHLDVDTSIPLGLIINELVSNTFKHAYRNKSGNLLFISLNEEQDELCLIVKDNGVGTPSEFDVDSSFGLQLIYAFTEELNGQIQFENHQGTQVKITLKNYRIMPDTEANEMSADTI